MYPSHSYIYYITCFDIIIIYKSVGLRRSDSARRRRRRRISG